jgi:hypothetical protein
MPYRAGTSGQCNNLISRMALFKTEHKESVYATTSVEDGVTCWGDSSIFLEIWVDSMRWYRGFGRVFVMSRCTCEEEGRRSQYCGEELGRA